MAAADDQRVEARGIEAYGLSAADFAVLVILARIGGGRAVSQRRLMEELGLTSGTVSVRMDRLVAADLVRRDADPDSRRTTRITLTERGRELFERVVPAHLANEHRLLAALDDEERDQLAALLRKLLVEFEGSRPPADGPVPLGLTVAPAYAAMALRESVGLPAMAGLLVRRVDAAGAGARAGVRPGDLLLAAGRHELRSVGAVYAAVQDADGSFELRVQRGTEEHRLTVEVDRAAARSTGHAAVDRPARCEHRV